MCGIAHVTGMDNAAEIALAALTAIQGRGHQAAGVGVWQDGKITVSKAEGMIRNLQAKLKLKPLPGRIASAHTRYGTAGANLLQNAHPFVSEDGCISVVHNGEILDADQYRPELEALGVTFQSTSDSEVILRLLEKSSGEGIVGRVLSVLNRLTLAYAVVIIWDGYTIAACDCRAVHPLHLGRFPGGGHILASEDAAIRTVGATPIKHVKPGHVIVISPDQDIHSFWLDGDKSQTAHCSFNFVYTARPDSCLWGRSVTKVREALGLELFDELSTSDRLPKVDLIVPVLDSGRTATLSFAQAYGRQRILALLAQEGPAALEKVDLDFWLPFAFGINRAHDLRNFQVDTQGHRDQLIILKHGIDPAVVRGKRVAIGDDSIVRATTSKRIVDMLRAAGATEVHVLSFSPPVIASCPYGGTETKDGSLLTAASRTIEEIQLFIGADSLHYLSIPGFKKVVNAYGLGHCMGCFTNEFPSAA
ncbi:MAG: amidophosphoribosyltransferase [Candidatus Buchananbacteria bacterium]